MNKCEKYRDTGEKCYDCMDCVFSRNEINFDEKEFNLSKYIEDDDDIVDGKIPTDFVREFIRILKERCPDKGFGRYMIEQINKFAGDKLT